MLRAEHLQIGYSKTIASALEISVSPGELFALVGRNGSGKSTLLQTLRGHIPPLEGLLTLDGKPLNDWSINELATKIAWVHTRFSGIAQLTVLDYVILGRTPYLNHMGSWGRKDIDLAEQALKHVNAFHLSHKETTTLSDGERQLVSIARALAQDTPYLFLDEPTAFLDFYHRRTMFALLSDIASKQNKGILMSTHELDLVVDHKFKVMVLNQKGEITQKNAPVSLVELQECLV